MRAHLCKSLRDAWREDAAQTTSEYGINTVLIAVGAVAAVLAIGAGVKALFGHVSTCLSAANAPGGGSTGC